MEVSNAFQSFCPVRKSVLIFCEHTRNLTNYIPLFQLAVIPFKLQYTTPSARYLLARFFMGTCQLSSTVERSLSSYLNFSRNMSVPIVVVGAGVIGLTTALQLKKSNKSFDITVVANYLPGDYNITYTSPFAGANWHSFASLEDKKLQEIDKPGYFEFLKLAEDPRSGVWKKPNALFYTQAAMNSVNGDKSQLASWFDEMANTRDLSSEELAPGTVYGHEFDGVVISVPIYLPYLVQRCLEAGIQVRRVPAVQHIDQARELHHSGLPAKLVINCTGLTASSIKGVDDPANNYPVKGQVVVVRNHIDKVVSVSGSEENEMLYIFPRKEGGAIIGGCFLKDNWDATEDLALTQRILQRALKYVPDIVDPRLGNPPHLDIVKVNVGLRPFRDGGVRLEIDPKRNWLIHNYGAGGGGYQGSYGCAEVVVDLVGQALAKSKL